MNTNLAVDDKVSLIPFKHKGKLGIVKFIGEVAGKPSGNWVGVELEEPTGTCSGEHEENTFFECKPNHGIFLRPGQMKSLEEKTIDVSTIIHKTDAGDVESGITAVENMRAALGSGEGDKDHAQVLTDLNRDPTAESPDK